MIYHITHDKNPMLIPMNTKNWILAGCLATGVLPAGAAVLADYDFVLDAAGNPVTPGSTVTQNNIFNGGNTATPNTTNAIGGNPTYATYSVPTSGIGSNGDGLALRVGPNNNDGNLWFPDFPELKTNGNFSMFARVQFDSLNGFISIMGRPQGNYFLYVRDDGKLDLFAGGLGDIFATDPNSPILETGQWYDIGFSFEGVGDDANVDLVKLYVNGVNVAQFTGTANFGTGDFFHLGANGAGDQTMDGLIDRVIIWDEVVGDAEFAALSVPEPSALLLSVAGLGVMLGRRKRRNS